jgi:hypothetical protein
MPDPQTTDDDQQIVLELTPEMVEKCFADFERDFPGQTPEQGMRVTSKGGTA